VRPVNLIPKEERRSESPFAGRSGGGVYVVLGVLGAAVLAVLAVVLTSNGITDRKDKLAELKRKQATAETAAAALRPYGTFVDLQKKRVETVDSLVNSSFNWGRVIRSLAKTIPSDVWLTTVKGTVAPGVELDTTGSGSGGSLEGLRANATSPTVELIGCTYTQDKVARMMVDMRNISDVTDVVLGKSERPESTQTQPSGGQGGSAGECRTNYHITKFEILVVLGGASTAATAASPGSTSSPVGQAQSTASPSSSPTPSSTTTTTGGGQ
jgi:Tfp pilus assembly protein PilN